MPVSVEVLRKKVREDKELAAEVLAEAKKELSEFSIAPPVGEDMTGSGRGILQALYNYKADQHAALSAVQRELYFQRVDTHNGELVDYGSWITWVLESAPKALVGAAVMLKHVGITATDRELRRLIDFHDTARKYPTRALLPEWRALAPEVGELPPSLTIAEARRIVAGLTLEGFGRILAARGRRYMKECQPDEIWGWKAAWRRAGKVGQRLVAALGKTSEDVEMDEKAQPWDWEEELPPLRYPLPPGTFIWNPRAGLALSCELAPTGEVPVEIFVWQRNDYARFQLAKWRMVSAAPESRVVDIEKRAFWTAPSWYPEP